MSVLGAIVPLFVAAVAASCVVPPPLQTEQVDAGLNSIPVMVDSPFQATGTIAIPRDQQEPVTLTVRDLDQGDSVYVFFYVDYGLPELGPPLNECRASGGKSDRQLTCALNSLCYRIPSPDDQLHFLEAVIADRDRLDSGEPINRAFPEGTGLSYRAWLMTCID
ncbi:hypothetical protein [Haliangium sp.]|uniref:hypothetical protein n=1 Tax=Haliangium sp. TaxID=2663208 RepID=UPI003D12731A